MLLAALEPGIISTVLCPLLSLNFFKPSFLLFFKRLSLNGFPVTVTFPTGKYFTVSSNPAVICVTKYDNILLAKPGTTLGSCMSVFLPAIAAIKTAGYEAKPPVPITISGFTSFIIEAASKNDLITKYEFIIFLKVNFLI